jgi:hypothetical protein
METLELITQTNSKVGKYFRVIKASLSQKVKEQDFTSAKAFNLADYLRNSKGYVLGHAAFTK